MQSFDEIYNAIQNGHKTPDWDKITAYAYELYSQAQDENRPLFLHQEKARKNDGELVKIFREYGVNRFGVFAYEGEEDVIISEMQEWGYIHADKRTLSSRGRLFAQCMMFDLITNNKYRD